MKNFIIGFFGLLLVNFSCQSEKFTPFQQCFANKCLRIDYFHTGNATKETVKIDSIYSYGHWAGSLVNLIDTLNYGTYFYKIYDKTSGTLIYSKGFDSYFKEYQLSKLAVDGQTKQFHETAMIPFPNSTIFFVLEKRNKSGDIEEVFRTEIDPEVAREKNIDPDVQVYSSLNNGDAHIKADIAIVGEGYTTNEADKFEKDLKRFTEVFFRAEPCSSNKSKFNIRGVLKPSQDSGIDEPRAGIDKNTVLGASFNTMGSERYVLIENNKSLRDVAGHVPYDALYIMVNHSRYGGGGIYNFYCVFTTDNIDSDYLMVHEFGHSFFGLADEYYTSSTAYDNFYTSDKEPNEPNVTALKDPENIKWKHLVTEGVSLPTPWGKSVYDSLDVQWQKQRAVMNDAIAALQNNGASEKEVAEAKAYYDLKSTERNKEVQQYLERKEFKGKVGAFEGDGYEPKGLFRPSINCIMFTKTDYFCPVCQEAMRGVIESYAH